MIALIAREIAQSLVAILRRRRNEFSLGLSALGFMWPAMASATMTIPLVRELTPIEVAEYAASESDAVVVGRIENSLDGPTTGVLKERILVRPEVWLKGESSEPTIRIAVSVYDYDGLSTIAAVLAQHPKPRVLCFLRNVAGQLVLQISPYYKTLLPLDNPGASQRIALAERAIVNGTREELAERA